MRKIIIGLGIMLAMLSSCRTVKYVPIEGGGHIEYITNTLRDSIHVLDSVLIRITPDTVFYTRWKVQYIEKVRMDSIHVIDSVLVSYPVIKEVKVEKQLSRWQNFKLELGGLLLGILIAVIILVVIKVIKTVRTSGWGALKLLFKL